MTKKIFSFLLLAGMLGMIGLGTIRANFSLEASLASNYPSTVHFNQQGDDFAGLFLPRGETTLGIPQTISLSGSTTFCSKQLLGYYVNPQRGNRVRPLDSASLTILQGLDSSYSGLVLDGGLFFACSGELATNLYGQVKHTYLGSDYVLLAGVDYDFSSGTYMSSYSGTAEFKSILGKYTFNNYLYDTWGGIGQAVSTVALYGGTTSLTGTVNTGTTVVLSGDIVVAGTGFDGYVLFSGIDIIVSGFAWNGIIVPPSVAVGTGAANIGESGLNLSGTFLTTIQVGATGSNLVASGGTFLVSFVVSNGIVGQQLSLYRSEDGNVRVPNSPDTGCVLDSNKYCVFRTDALSFFGVLALTDGTRTTVGDGVLCTDQDGCVCNGLNIASGAQCIIAVIPPVVVTSSNGGGSYTLREDNCFLDPSKDINLPGANLEGKDYSRSYYDRDCGVSSTSPIDLETADLGSIKNSPYSYDLNQGYLYGYANKLTLADTVQKAGMKDTMTRKDLAVMMAGYAMRVLGIQPNANKKGCDKFTDTKRLNGDAQLYIMWSCQLGLMGLDTNGKVLSKFRPNELVTRAHFAAIFSRLLFGTQYDGGTPYYEKHIAGLATHAIIKSEQNPDMKERKGYVMLMMMRADKKDVGRAKYHASAAENGALALLSE